MLVVSIISIVALGFIIQLVLFHAVLIMRNMTTYEFIKFHAQKGANPDASRAPRVGSGSSLGLWLSARRETHTAARVAQAAELAAAVAVAAIGMIIHEEPVSAAPSPPPPQTPKTLKHDENLGGNAEVPAGQETGIFPDVVDASISPSRRESPMSTPMRRISVPLENIQSNEEAQVSSSLQEAQVSSFDSAFDSAGTLGTPSVSSVLKRNEESVSSFGSTNTPSASTPTVLQTIIHMISPWGGGRRSNFSHRQGLPGAVMTPITPRIIIDGEDSIHLTTRGGGE